jgi:hypothetical protein
MIKRAFDFAMSLFIVLVIVMVFMGVAYYLYSLKKDPTLPIQSVGSISVKEKIDGFPDQTIEIYYFKKNDIQCVVSVTYVSGRLINNEINCVR